MITTYFKELLAGNIWGTKKDPGIPATYYLGLSSTPGATGGTGVTEPSGGGYSRVELTPLGQPTGGVVKNTSSIEFPTSTAEWLDGASIQYYTIHDAKTGGHLLICSQLRKPRVVPEDTVIIAETGEIELKVDELP